MLRWNPKERITAKEALQHRYFLHLMSVGRGTVRSIRDYRMTTFFHQRRSTLIIYQQQGIMTVNLSAMLIPLLSPSGEVTLSKGRVCGLELISAEVNWKRHEIQEIN